MNNLISFWILTKISQFFSAIEASVAGSLPQLGFSRMMKNPDYKGVWKPKMIKNPDYKGKSPQQLERSIVVCVLALFPLSNSEGLVVGVSAEQC